MSHLTRDDAARMGQRVNEILRAYIAAQNSLFKFSFAKAFGLKQPDPAPAAAQTETLKAQIQDLLEEIREAKLDSSLPLDSFFITLRPYLRDITAAMDFFTAFCGRMINARKAKDKKYWKEDYKLELEQLQQKERAYLETGLELNKRWAKLTGKDAAQA